MDGAIIKLHQSSLASVLPLVEHHPTHQKLTGSILGQGIGLAYGLHLCFSLIDVFIYLSFSLLSL